MRTYFFRLWHKVGFIIMPDLYKEAFRRFSFLNKLHYGYDIINQKKMYKKDRKRFGVFKTIENVYEQVDKFINEYQKKQNLELTCKNGCAYCCTKEVFISDDEANVLYNYALKNSIQIDYAKAHYQAVNKFNIPLHHRSCIFLDAESKSCKVYEVRPLCCRLLFSRTDAKYCLDEKLGKPQYLMLFKLENTKTAIWNSSISGILPAMLMKQTQDKVIGKV